MGYLREVVFAAIVCGVLVRLAPTGKSGGGKYVKYVASLVFLCILVSPLVGELEAVPEVISGIADIGNTVETGEISETNTDGYVGSLDVVSSEICRAAGRAAAENFSVSAENFKIKLIIDKSDSGEYSIREATVYPTGDAANIGTKVLAEYFGEILGCQAEVIMGE